jgi:hypothetical protein
LDAPRRSTCSEAPVLADHQIRTQIKPGPGRLVGASKNGTDLSTRARSRLLATGPFTQGNPGRKPGTKNRTTIVAAALLEGEAEELVRKAVELALGGTVPMLKFLLGRILQRERLIELDLQIGAGSRRRSAR